MVTTSTFAHAARLGRASTLRAVVPKQIRHPGGPGETGDPAEGLG
jgi:hypothetical protein